MSSSHSDKQILLCKKQEVSSKNDICRDNILNFYKLDDAINSDIKSKTAFIIANERKTISEILVDITLFSHHSKIFICKTDV